MVGAMTAPGPALLGRSVVISSADTVPTSWADAALVMIDDRLLHDRLHAEAEVRRLQRHYVERVPMVFDLRMDAAVLAEPEIEEGAPHELGASFTFLRERLHKIIWHNSYDARSEGLIWWWAHKAQARLPVTVGGPADVLTEDGRPIWIDGGPRQSLDLAEMIIHHETVELGRDNAVPERRVPGADLATDQLAAVAHEVGPARVIAPAGSGKTRVLTSRMRHLLDDRAFEPEIVTALAYNRRAADEMVGRLGGGRPPHVRTIHSIGWEILRMARPGVALIGEADQRRRIEAIASPPPRTNTDVIGPYLEALDEVRVGLVEPGSVELSRDDVPGFADVFRRYRAGLVSRNEADHAEQVYGAVEALCRQPELRALWQGRCRHLLVDEFQDLTPAYLLLIRMLAGAGLDVFGVGDDDQVIYGYAGADPGFLIDFEELFPGAGSHALEVNYRCPADVVDAAATLLGYNRRRVEKVITPASSDEGMHVVTAPGDRLAVELAGQVAALIEEGVEPSAMAVLARVHSSLLPVHVALAERGIPFSSHLSTGLLDRTVMRGAMAWLRIALDPAAMSRNDIFEAVRRPQRGLTRLMSELLGRRRGPFSLSQLIEIGVSLDGRRADRWNEFCEDVLLASRSTGSSSRLLEVLSTGIGLERAASALDSGRTRADKAAQSDDLTALRRVAAMAPGPEELEAWLRGHLGARGDGSGVALSTVHRVKGLEWDHVMVFGADRGSMPHALSTDVEEERRVFHVAITRARVSATVYADVDRPSQFLTEMDGSAPLPVADPVGGAMQERGGADGVHVVPGDDLSVPGGYRGVVTEVLTTGVLIEIEESGASMAIPWGERVEKRGAVGRLTPGAGGPDAALVERLKAWRLAEAQRQGVPAYVVFNDRTIEELAAMRPSTGEALLAVSGIGPAKLESYGEDLLDLLA